MPANIFISFASQDRKIAQTICSALESRGFECWISARDILPGENFQVAIVQAIRRAKIMLLVFTENSNNSQEMTKELALASQQKLIVIPLRVEDVTPSDAFAYEFATRQWIDLFSDWESAIEQLSQRIAKAIAMHGEYDGSVVSTPTVSFSPGKGPAPPEPPPVEETYADPDDPSADVPLPPLSHGAAADVLSKLAAGEPQTVAEAAPPPKSAKPPKESKSAAAIQPPAPAPTPEPVSFAALTEPERAADEREVFDETAADPDSKPRKMSPLIFVAIGLAVIIGAGLAVTQMMGGKPESPVATTVDTAAAVAPIIQAPLEPIPLPEAEVKVEEKVAAPRKKAPEVKPQAPVASDIPY